MKGVSIDEFEARNEPSTRRLLVSLLGNSDLLDELRAEVMRQWCKMGLECGTGKHVSDARFWRIKRLFLVMNEVDSRGLFFVGHGS